MSRRLPHPHLISSTFLARQGPQSPSTVALLSLSSVASRLPGLGMQCLPVLSFHSVDDGNQELTPMAWGPPRKVPSTSTPMASPTLPKATRKASSDLCTGGDGVESLEIPGSFQPSTVEQAPSSSRQRASSSRKHGPAAMGATKTPDEVRNHEEALAKAPLTRAHVPIPFADALGAHLLLSLPARAGGGVLLFSESSILHVPPPSADQVSVKSPKVSATGSGKRRKAGMSSSGPRRPSGSSTSLVPLSTSPVATTLPASTAPARSNENGKRRRSTAGSQALSETSEPHSPTATRRSHSALLSWMTRILRLELGSPVIVASAVVVSDPSLPDDDGVQVDSDEVAKAALQALFGTHAGHLYLLTISLERLEGNESEVWLPIEMVVKRIGPIPAPGGPAGLTYLGENYVSVASTGGDSVLVHIDATQGRNEVGDGDVAMNGSDEEAAALAPTLDVVHRWPNLAPIMDFVVDDGAGVDPGQAKSAQARIITCSGTGSTGSLRIVRNGVSFEDILALPEARVRRLWSVSEGNQTALVLLSYHDGTRILSVEPNAGGFEDITGAFAAAGWKTDTAVLDAQSLANGNFVVINKAGVFVWSVHQRHLLASWTPAELSESPLQSASISNVAVNESGQVLIALNTSVALLQVGSDGAVQLLRVEDMQSEVSALDISSLTKGRGATYAAVCLWTPCAVKLLRLSDWQDVTPSTLASTQPSLIRSVVLHTFTSSGVPTSEPHLLLGLGDGTLNSYALSLPTADSLSSRVGVLEKRSASMGTQPLRLRSFETANGLHAVFVCCERPSVVYSHGKSLQYSSARHRDVSDVCQFNMEDQALVIFARLDQLVLSRMGQIQKLDVGTVELGAENPVSLAMCADSRTVAVAANEFLPEGRQADVAQGGKVILFDYDDFVRLDDHQLELEERVNCIESATVLQQKVLIVGTGFTFPDRSETLSGRILVFAVTGKTDRKLRLLASHNVDGNTYAVGTVADYLVACVNSKVVALEVQAGDEENGKATPTSLRLLQAGEWACAFTAITLRPVGTDMLVIGDALRSIVLLQVDTKSGKVQELARDCDPYWTMAAEVLEEEEQVFLGCDIGFNLWTCSRLRWTDKAKRLLSQARTRNLEAGRGDAAGSDGIDDSWSNIMQRDAAFHYGDLINTIKRGALTAPIGAQGIDSRVIFGTAAGAIGVVARVQDRVATVLSQLEQSLRDQFEPLGRISAEE